jgi:hypothetical protein
MLKSQTVTYIVNFMLFNAKVFFTHTGTYSQLKMALTT